MSVEMLATFVKKGTVAELRRALPPVGVQRKAAVRQRTENGISLLDLACFCHRFDMARRWSASSGSTSMTATPS